jgi:formylglycine-generating enzyme required for sulfatase activity
MNIRTALPFVAIVIIALCATRALSIRDDTPKPLDCTGEGGASAETVRKAQEAWAKQVPGNKLEESVKIAEGVEMKFVLLPPGKFRMGSAENEKDRNADEVQHVVTISKPFYLGVHAVTRGQYRRFVDDTGYKTEAERGKGGMGWDAKRRDVVYGRNFTWRDPGFEQTDEHPVVLVDWLEAVKFAEWLAKKDGHTYRLPTEAEWEYACRAGSTGRFSFGEDDEEMVKHGNLADESFRKATGKNYGLQGDDGYAFTAPVGRFRPNAFGLYDMYGNACQWCSDLYAPYPTEAVSDPTGPLIGESRTFRSGGWRSGAVFCRSALRHWIPPDNRFSYLGFRLVRVVSPNK